jgi:hypothetical protein
MTSRTGSKLLPNDQEHYPNAQHLRWQEQIRKARLRHELATFHLLERWHHPSSPPLVKRTPRSKHGQPKSNHSAHTPSPIHLTNPFSFNDRCRNENRISNWFRNWKTPPPICREMALHLPSHSHPPRYRYRRHLREIVFLQSTLSRHTTSKRQKHLRATCNLSLPPQRLQPT